MDNNISDSVAKKAMKELLQELNEDPLYKFKLVFGIMSVIPFLAFFYIFISLGHQEQIFSPQRSAILFITIFISLCGFVWGYGVIRKIFNKLIVYASKVKHSEELKSELVASVSHDFKSPISIIQLSLSTITDSSLGQINEKQKNRLLACQDSLNHMLHTVTTLLDLYKVEAGMVSLDRKLKNIKPILEKQLKEFEVIFEKKRIKLNVDILQDNLFSMIDEDKIVEVVSNLLSNALKYTPEDGAVTVKSYASGDFIRTEFINSQVEIPNDKLATIFEKFHRLNSAQEGTGLGLAIAKDIVKIHGGYIWAENLPNKQVKFVVTFPLAKARS